MSAPPVPPAPLDDALLDDALLDDPPVDDPALDELAAELLEPAAEAPPAPVAPSGFAALQPNSRVKVTRLVAIERCFMARPKVVSSGESFHGRPSRLMWPSCTGATPPGARSRARA